MKAHALRPRTLLIAVLAACLAGSGALLVQSDRASGAAAAAQYEYGAPAPLTAPVLNGSAQVGQQLTVTPGTWQSPTSIVGYQYRWNRCNAAGTTCNAIADATANTYVVTSSDVGFRLRAAVWAINSGGGQTEGDSNLSAVVPGTTTTTTTTTTPAGGSKVIAASGVTLPNRLVIDRVAYSQNPIRSRLAPTQMRVHVADSSGRAVQGALVYVLGVPYNRIAPAAEVATDGTGWATVNLMPLRAFPRTGYLVLFVRARVQGQDILGGTSSRRLVQATIGTPNGT